MLSREPTSEMFTSLVMRTIQELGTQPRRREYTGQYLSSILARFSRVDAEEKSLIFRNFEKEFKTFANIQRLIRSGQIPRVFEEKFTKANSKSVLIGRHRQIGDIAEASLLIASIYAFAKDTFPLKPREYLFLCRDAYRFLSQEDPVRDEFYPMYELFAKDISFPAAVLYRVGKKMFAHGACFPGTVFAAQPYLQ